MRFLKFILILSLLIFSSYRIAKAQNELDVIRNNWLQYTDAQNSFYHFLAGEAFRLLELRSEKISLIKTKEELLQRQEEVRKTMWNILGPFPEKYSLNAWINGTV